MAYDNQYCAKINVGFAALTTHTVFSYQSATDTLSTILASGYFASLAASENVKVGDIFLIKGSDGNSPYRVTVATTTDLTFAPFSGQDLITTTVIVSSAELLALRATPKTLVSAPGGDRILKFVDAQLVLDYNSAAYVESADNLVIRYTNGSGAIVSDTIETTGFIDQTADTVTNAVAVKDVIVAATASVNQALVLHNSGDGEFTTGDSPIYVTLTYRIINANLAVI